MPVRVFHNLSSETVTVPGGQALKGQQTYEWTVQGIGAETIGDPPARDSFMTLLPSPVPTSPAGRIVINDQRPTFRWTPVAGASQYELRVRRGTFDGTVVYRYEGNATSHQVRAGEALGANTFFWDVRAWGKKDPGAWSIQGVFEIATAPNNPPRLVRPAADSELRRVLTEFEWEGNPQATRWELEVVRVANGETVFHDENIPGRVFRIPAGRELWGDRLHDYRVRAWNELGHGPWSETWRFRTGMPESAVIAPTGEVEVHTQRPTLEWKVVNGANRYKIELRKGDVNGELKYEATVEAEGATVIPAANELGVGSSYVWRVRPCGPTLEGFFTTWSKFSVRTAPRNKPTLESPSNRAFDRSVKPMLRWSGNPQATSFELEVYDAGDLGAPIIRRTVTGAREYHITGAETLRNYQTVHWRVRAVNEIDVGPWSDMWWFTTRLGKPVLVSPSSGVAINTRVPTFRWSPVTGATGYSLQVRQAATNGTIVYEAEVSGTSQAVPGTRALPVGGTVFWRVQAKGSGGQRGDWSDWGSFPIRTAPIDEPRLTSPRDDATGVSTTPLLKWEGTPQSTSYDVRVYRVANGELEYSRNGLTAEQVQIPSSSELWGDRLHDVILRGRNEVGAGDWSEPSRFRTLIKKPTLSSPGPNVTLSDQRPMFVWGSVLGANSYTVEVRRGSTTGPVVHSRTVTGTSSRAASQLGANNRFYWKVRANGAQNSSAWSGTRWFEIRTAPNNPPTLVAPVNLAQDRRIRPTLKWEGNPQATYWQIELFRKNAPETVILRYPNAQHQVTTREFRIPEGNDLLHNRNYLWRVRAWNEIGPGPWSGKWEFKTQAP